MEPESILYEFDDSNFFHLHHSLRPDYLPLETLNRKGPDRVVTRIGRWTGSDSRPRPPRRQAVFVPHPWIHPSVHRATVYAVIPVTLEL